MSQPRFLSICFSALFTLSQVASAGVITLSMSPPSQSVEQGGSGYVLNFALTTAVPLDLAGFNITVTAPDSSGITFIGGDASVANYVFAADLSGLFLFGNPSVPNGHSGDISDVANSGNLVLAAGTYDLGRMFFNVASNAPLATVNIILDGSTSFTDGLTFDPIAYTPAGGSTIGAIEVMLGANPIPEPSTLVVVAVMSLAVGMFRNRRPAGHSDDIV